MVMAVAGHVHGGFEVMAVAGHVQGGTWLYCQHCCSVHVQGPCDACDSCQQRCKCVTNW